MNVEKYCVENEGESNMQCLSGQWRLWQCGDHFCICGHYQSNPKRCFALYCLITVKRSSQDGPGFPAITMIKEVEITCRFITFD